MKVGPPFPRNERGREAECEERSTGKKSERKKQILIPIERQATARQRPLTPKLGIKERKKSKKEKC